MGRNKNKKTRMDAGSSAAENDAIFAPLMDNDAGSSTSQSLVQEDAGSSTSQSLVQKDAVSSISQPHVQEDAGSSTSQSLVEKDADASTPPPQPQPQDLPQAWAEQTREMQVLHAENKDHEVTNEELKKERDVAREELLKAEKLNAMLQRRIMGHEMEMDANNRAMIRMKEAAEEKKEKIIRSEAKGGSKSKEIGSLRQLNQSMAANIVEYRNEIKRKDGWLATARQGLEEMMEVKLKSGVLERANEDLKAELQQAKESMEEMARQQDELQQELLETKDEEKETEEILPSSLAEEGVESERGTSLEEELEAVRTFATASTQTESCDDRPNTTDASTNTTAITTMSEETQTETCATGELPDTTDTITTSQGTRLLLAVMWIMMILAALSWWWWCCYEEREFWLRANKATRLEVVAMRDEEWVRPLWTEEVNFSAENWFRVERKVTQ